MPAIKCKKSRLPAAAFALQRQVRALLQREVLDIDNAMLPAVRGGE